MSESDLETPRNSRRWLWLVVGAMLLGVLAWVIFGGPEPRRTGFPGGFGQSAENPLDSARQALARDTSLDTCRSALQQINSSLRQTQGGRLPTLSAEQMERLSKLFGLDEDERAEIDSSNFTLLDAHHLDLCFLLRDAAQSLQVSGLPQRNEDKPVRRSPLERAKAGFDWVVRHVRIQDEGGPVLPPAFVLRRGWGSTLERGLIFLALLQQLGPAEELQGCLVYCPEKQREGEAPAVPPSGFWACGVQVEGGKDLFLFDPRLGLPLPGPGGQGVATLAEAAQDAAVLGQLNVKDTARYDVTSERASAAEARLVCSLSSLAPRMRYLQDQLLAPTVQVNLTSALTDLERLSKALPGKETLLAWREQTPDGSSLDGPGLLRRFLPVAEGGVDPGRLVGDQKFFRQQEFIRSLLPRNAFPSRFFDEERFPPHIGLGQRIRQSFALPFVRSVLDPDKPRNLILRGRFSKAAPELVKEQRDLQKAAQKLQTAVDVPEKVEEWLQKMVPLYARQITAQQENNAAELEEANRQIEQLWQQADAVALVLQGAMAWPRNLQVSYLLGLCKHDQAEQMQARLELRRREKGAVNKADIQQTQATWGDALNAWDGFLAVYPKEPSSGSARQMKARALAVLGRWQEAAATWEDPSQLTPLEKVAGLYLAQQVRKANEKR